MPRPGSLEPRAFWLSEVKAGRQWGWQGGAEAEKSVWPARSTENTSSLGQYLHLGTFLAKIKEKNNPLSSKELYCQPALGPRL